MIETISETQAKDILASLGEETQKLKEIVAPSNHYSPGVSSSVEERALSLLGAGVQQESVASALGVTPSRIAQLLSNEDFASKVAKLRYDNLQKHNERDNKYDTIEDSLLNKLEKSLPLLIRPESILKAMQVVNNAKRRGSSNGAQIINQQNIVNLTMPNVIAQKFAVNINNQVVKAGDQELLTITARELLNKVNPDADSVNHSGQLISGDTSHESTGNTPT